MREALCNPREQLKRVQAEIDALEQHGHGTLVQSSEYDPDDPVNPPIPSGDADHVHKREAPRRGLRRLWTSGAEKSAEEGMVDSGDEDNTQPERRRRWLHLHLNSVVDRTRRQKEASSSRLDELGRLGLRAQRIYRISYL
ncbi:hypothetical protein JCM10213_003561 [Rhodosporidiobolus nylandii]